MSQAPYVLIPDSLKPTVRALARVILPEEMEVLGITEDVVDHVELTLDSFPRHYRAALLTGMGVFDATAMLYPPAKGRPFRMLDKATAEAWFEAWWTSPIEVAQAFPKGIKALFALAYYEHPTIRERLAYHPDQWIAKVAKRRFDKWATADRDFEARNLAPDPLTNALAKGHALAARGEDEELEEARHA